MTIPRQPAASDDDHRAQMQDLQAEMHAKMRAAMIDKYGQPTQSVEEYDRPYKAGDGREEEAVKKGSARIYSL